ncbi:OsmC family protein [Caulobacter mirabilis]|uniref:Osmotically inducible protein C n=1 Tax=Caulobacter mirabilis TaxID=69666 RepID=A0A2D2B067_9CAUL|nr:OsmC family protein [Caulobacter mirabilis]ATQ43634.1 osmotically inducible protein C [Caulobacter mirabilis]
MARATVSSSGAEWATHIKTGRHELLSDEPQALGGQDAGPAPYDLLLASLGSCTAITLRMYAQRKQWTLREVGIELSHHKEENRSKIHRVITLQGDLDEEQRARLADIAERTPVTLTLKEAADIHTELAK